jgi:group I intron endonuclease
MFYLVYKITNLINGKYYIGMHQTTDINDGYMGSGKKLKLAIRKYGIDSFVKEILHVFDNETDMRNKEKELVIISENTYNLCDGGKGGFSYINRSGKNLRTGVVLSDETKKKISKSKKGTPHWNKGGTISDETKKKISINTSLALKGTKKSDEHKKNLSESIKLWHKNKKAGIV